VSFLCWATTVPRRSCLTLVYFFVLHVFSVLPQHKITNGIGLSAEEHVEWMLKDDVNYREGRVNAINAALGETPRQLVNEYMPYGMK